MKSEARTPGKGSQQLICLYIESAAQGMCAYLRFEDATAGVVITNGLAP